MDRIHQSFVYATMLEIAEVGIVHSMVNTLLNLPATGPAGDVLKRVNVANVLNRVSHVVVFCCY